MFAPDDSAVEASLLAARSPGRTVVVVDAVEGRADSDWFVDLFRLRYERYPPVEPCRVGDCMVSSSSGERGERFVHRSMRKSVVSVGRFWSSARP